MESRAPQIGVDRFIRLDWMAIALRVRTDLASLDELTQQFDAAGLGKEARVKTLTKLRALCLEPRKDLVDFANRGFQLYREQQETSVPALAWGMAIASYPFFGKVAEFTGRLTSIQGDCSALEIHRRMNEVFGDREVVKRATQAVLQTQADWGGIERVDNGKRLIRRMPLALTQERTISWLVEAAIRYLGKTVSVPTLNSMAVLFPFTFAQSLAYVVSKSPALELRSEGSNSQFVALRAPV